MAMALAQAWSSGGSLNAFQVSMHTTSVHGNARLKRIDTERIRRELDNRKIVIVTGFQGITNTMITPLWEEAVLIRQQLHWQQPFMQMPVRSIQMWTAFILLIRVRCRMPEN